LLSPVVLFITFFYSYTKRFTWTSHFFLGVAIGIAPSAAWIAVMGRLDVIPVLITLAVLTWIGGFDILYACQDYQFDTTHGLYSIPQRFGIRRALYIARILHVITFSCFFIVGFLSDLHLIYGIGISTIAGLLIYEHRLIHPEDLSKINLAFFNVNGIISALFFLITLTDVLVYH
jgi:4-hydroxybenzoate polyprenyltransferase